MRTIFRFALIFTLASYAGLAQDILDQPLRNVSAQPLPAFLAELESQYPLRVFFLEEWLSPYTVDDSLDGSTLRETLDQMLEGADIQYTLLYGYALVFSKDPASAIIRESILSRALIQRKIIERRIIGDKSNLKPGQLLTLQGVISDQDKGHPMEGASLSVNDEEEKFADASGRFQVQLLPGEYVLSFNHPQYEGMVIDLGLYESGSLNVALQETPIMLEEVVISDEMILDRNIGKTSLSISQIKRAPTFLGEVDVIKQVQSQPGVTTVGEIASGFNVRGGSADQNLVLYDDVPVLNTSHAMGFFTAFNPEAVAEISFYRGGIPAQYGGRVSSVLNIVSRQGDFQKWTGAGGIGIISSHVTLGGPIRKDTTSLLMSFRSSYSNWMLRAVQSEYQDVMNTSAHFYDGSMKLTHKLSEKSQLTFSGYTSSDQFSLADDTTYHWKNYAGAIRFDHRFNEKLFSSIALTYGQYAFMLSEDDADTAFELDYSILYPSLKVDFQRSGKHTWSFGLHNTYYRFSPGKLQPASDASDIPFKEMDPERGIESALYVSDAFDLSDRWLVEAGMRFSMFNHFGPTTVYRYREDAPMDVRNIEASVHYGAGEISKTYAVAEPRVALRFTVDPNTALKIGYHRMAQYMHLITNTAAIAPTDIWQSSNAHFKPQIADQLSAGIFRNFGNNHYETFVETYYKKVRNTLDFKDGANLILNPHLETALVSTTATAYGVEFSASKVRGRLLGSASYAWSRSLRMTDSRFDTERINNGRTYAANYDQPHVVNLNWRYGISRRIFFSGNFVYHTGRPVSLPTTLYHVDGVPISGFSERNQYRIPDYHRLDLAFIIEGNHNRKKFWDGNWIFSFYNVYARKNAYSVFFADDGSGYLRPYRLSVIGTVIPSITYNFKF